MHGGLLRGGMPLGCILAPERRRGKEKATRLYFFSWADLNVTARLAVESVMVSIAGGDDDLLVVFSSCR